MVQISIEVLNLFLSSQIVRKTEYKLSNKFFLFKSNILNPNKINVIRILYLT